MIVNEEKKIGIIFKHELLSLGSQGFFLPSQLVIIAETLDQLILINSDGTFHCWKNRFGSTGLFEPTQEQLELFTEMLL